jgi:hypothetical protein
MIFFYIFIIGVPTVLVLFFTQKILRIRAIEKHGVKTSALIIQIRLFKFSKGSTDSLTLEYSDSTGTRYKAKATAAPGQYRQGDTMALKYLSNKPSAYVIDGMLQGQWFLLIFCILLLAFAIFASYKVNSMVQGGVY